jgi:hypothetical protein
MLRLLLVLLALQLALLGAAASASAGGGDYALTGATPAEAHTVRSALDASAFAWDVVPVQVEIHVGDYETSHARRGHIWLDRGLLSAGRFAWATIQDEYAHQVDFFLFDGATRARLNTMLGGKDWCYGVAGLTHAEYGCERFASTLVWAYWPSKDNAYRPESRRDESAAMAPAAFRTLMASVLGPRVLHANR